MMTNEQNEIERLQNIVSRMTMLAQAGVCQMGAGGKHEFLRDLVRMGDQYGYDILGQPKADSNLPIPLWLR